MNEPEFEFAIDPDIRLARTLPARVYSDLTLFFARSTAACSRAPGSRPRTTMS
jgi:hypothetical protein